MKTHKIILSWLLISSLLYSQSNISFANTSMTILSSDEKEKIETEILKFQSNLLNSTKKYWEKLSSEFTKLTHYEEKWNMKFQLQVDENLIWKISSQWELKNYTIKNSLLNSDFSGNIGFNLDYTSRQKENTTINMDSFLSFITKDGDIYWLLKDLNFNINNEQWEMISNQIKKIFEENKYIKFPQDANTKMVHDYMNNINASHLYTQAKKILSQPLLTVYKKNQNKYILIPTKHACETYFEWEKILQLSNRWYTPKTCNDTIYKKFISEFIKKSELYLILWETENTLGFYHTDRSNTTIDLSISYQETWINKIDFIMTPEQKKHKNDWFNIHFSHQKYFKIILNAKDIGLFVNFHSELDNNNRFSEINSQIKSHFVNWNVTLKNNQLSWFYIWKEKTYDFKNGKEMIKNIYGLKIKWNTSKDNIITKLSIQWVWADLSTKKPFFTIKWNVNGTIFSLFTKINNGTQNMIINGKWSYDTDFFEFNSNYNISTQDFSRNTKKYSWNMNIQIDQKNNKNNLYVLFDSKDEIKEIFKIEIDGKAIRNYTNNIEIQAPKDFKEFDIKNLNYMGK